MLRAVRPPDTVGPGAHIRVISPGSPTLALVPDRAERAVSALEGLGYRVSFSKHAFGLEDDGLTSGTAAERAGDIMDAFTDPAVDAVLISDSGLGSEDLVAMLDTDQLGRIRKPFIGFCNTVYLNHYLALTHGVGSYYGSSLLMHLGDAPGPFPEALDYLGRALSADGPLEFRPVGPRSRPLLTWLDPDIESAPRVYDIPGGWTWLREGSSEGPLFGGNIQEIPDVVRQFGVDYTGAVLFWDLDLPTDGPPPIGRYLKGLHSVSNLDGLAGMVVGVNPYMDPQEWAELVAAELAALVPDADYPVLVNADISHAAPCWTLPYGERAILDTAAGLVFPRDTAR